MHPDSAEAVQARFVRYNSCGLVSNVVCVFFFFFWFLRRFPPFVSWINAAALPSFFQLFDM